MNERTKELAMQAGLVQYASDSKMEAAERFAELVRADLSKAAKMALDSILDIPMDRRSFAQMEAVTALRQALAQPDEVLAEREFAELVRADLSKAAKMALECLDYHWDNPDHEIEDWPHVLETKKALREALAIRARGEK